MSIDNTKMKIKNKTTFTEELYIQLKKEHEQQKQHEHEQQSIFPIGRGSIRQNIKMKKILPTFAVTCVIFTMLAVTSCHAFAIVPQKANIYPSEASFIGRGKGAGHIHKYNHLTAKSTGRRDFKSASERWMSSRGGNVGDGEGKTEKGFAELASALALLDEEQKNNNNKQASNRWTRLNLREVGREFEEKNSSQESSAYSSETADDAASSTAPKAMDFSSLLKGSVQQSQAAYLLEPPNGASPKRLVLFLGGAVLGSYPQVAYSEFLHRLSTETDAAILAVPYNVGLDHLEIAKHAEKMFTKAEEYVLEKVKPEWKSSFDNNIPRYAIGHSLGCKLHSLRMAALPQSAAELDGIAFLAFNNYGFGRSLGMARSFASQIFGVGGGQTNNAAKAGFNMNALFDIVEQVTSFAGFEFVPSPTDTERIIEMKLADNSSLNDFPRKCRLFQFEDDELDCSAEFDACFNNYVSPDQFNPDAHSGSSTEKRSDDTNESSKVDAQSSATTGTIVAAPVAPMTSTIPTTRLPGTHLTPVYINVQVNDLLKNTSPEARDMATQMTDLQGVSFGSEDELKQLVDKIAQWMKAL